MQGMQRGDCVQKESTRGGQEMLMVTPEVLNPQVILTLTDHRDEGAKEDLSL